MYFQKKRCIAMLLAGGQGSRLKVLTEKTAKPAVPFGGMPLKLQQPSKPLLSVFPGHILRIRLQGRKGPSQPLLQKHRTNRLLDRPRVLPYSPRDLCFQRLGQE